MIVETIDATTLALLVYQPRHVSLRQIFLFWSSCIRYDFRTFVITDAISSSFRTFLIMKFQDIYSIARIFYHILKIMFQMICTLLVRVFKAFRLITVNC